MPIKAAAPEIPFNVLSKEVALAPVGFMYAINNVLIAHVTTKHISTTIRYTIRKKCLNLRISGLCISNPNFRILPEMTVDPYLFI